MISAENNNTFKICLIGPIPKGDDERRNWDDWKIKYKESLVKLGDVEFADGDKWRDETKPMELVGHDAYLIKTADLIVVNAESQLGAGTAQEMAIAKYFHRPVITVLPKNTHHRRTNASFDGTKIDDWIHPFILVMSDAVVENLPNAIEWIKELRDNRSSKQIKDLSVIDKAIKQYRDFNDDKQ